MEFKTLKNIESSFRHLRLFSMLFLGACTLISVAAVWTSYRFAEAQRQKIYVLDQGKSLILALSQDMAQNRPVEAREHVRRFHELFFTLSPDREAIEGNVRRALYLADGSAIAYYQSLAEKGYFNRIIASNVSQNVVVDSIRCDFDCYPYAVETFARQKIVRESNVTERTLVTTCRLRNAVRSDNKTSEVMSAKDLQTRAEAWLKARMKRLTPRQRLGLVTVLLLVYAAVALMILFGGMRSRETSIPVVEHLRQPLLPERSLLPLNTSEDDTQER